MRMIDVNTPARVNILCYGLPNTGKTMNWASLTKVIPGNHFFISAESGTLSLRGESVVGCEVSSMAEMLDVYSFLTQSNEAKEIALVGIDSASEVGDFCLEEEMKKTKHGVQAYGAVLRRMRTLFKLFRDLPMHTYVTARQGRVQDEHSSMFYAPEMPGTKLGNLIPFLFDEVFCQRVFTDDSDKEDPKVQRVVQTFSDEKYIAKDRSGQLDRFEVADMGQIYKKILGEKKCN